MSNLKIHELKMENKAKLKQLTELMEETLDPKNQKDLVELDGAY